MLKWHLGIKTYFVEGDFVIGDINQIYIVLTYIFK